MNKPKVLILTEWYLPGYKGGGQVRTIHGIVENLKSKVDFYILTGNKDLGESKPYELKNNRWIEKDGVNIKYKKVSNVTYSILKFEIKKLKPNYVYPNSLFSYRFSLLPILACKVNFPEITVLLAPRGMLGKGALQIKSIKKKLFLRFTNYLGFFQFVIWHASTQLEKEEIENHFGPKSNTMIATDLSPMSSIKYSSTEKNVNSLNLVFISRISPKKNLKFAFDILDNIDKDIICKFELYGPVEDDGYWQKCLELIQELNSKANCEIIYKGEIHPSKLDEVFKKNHFFFMPTQHENYGHVILESLSYSRPVIISNNTPWLKLNQKNIGWDIDLNNRTEFINVLNHCGKMSQKEYDLLSKHTFDYSLKVLNPEKDILDNLKLFGIED